VDRGAWTETTGFVRNETYHEELPAILCVPRQANGGTVLWLTGEGKSGLYAGDGALQPEVASLVKAGATVVGVDLIYQGEFLKDGQPLTRTPRVKNPREAAPYTFGYNHAVFVQRVHDILSAVRAMKGRGGAADKLAVAGWGEAGPLVAAARAQARQAIDRAVIDTGGFRFGKIVDLHDPNFLPGGAKYGDLPALLALGAPGKTWVAGEGDEALKLARSIYKGDGVESELTRYRGETGKARASAVEWLLAESRK
jgi:hypothetical protein